MPSTRTVTARDLMQKDVLVLSPDDPIASAVASLEEYRVSGAPVVDSSGRLIGILSATDVVRSGHVLDRGLEVEHSVPYAADDEEEDDDLPSPPSTTEPERVKDWMHFDAVTVPPEAPLKRLCTLMVEHGIHRVPVVDGGKLLGIVTTFDVVRHVAEAG